MAVTGVLTLASGQWGYPIQGLGSYGGAEEKKPSFMLFTSEHYDHVLIVLNNLKLF